MNKCAEIREKAENFFLSCDDDQKEGIAEHLIECSDCMEKVAIIYGQSKVIENASDKSGLNHYSEAYIAGLLYQTRNHDLLDLVRKHVESCQLCQEIMDKLLEKVDQSADLFREAPDQYLK